MLQDFTLPDFDEIVTNMKYIFRFQLSAHVCLGSRRLYSIYIGKFFMFEIMESRVLAILLSTVVAFITEKATGIIATQLRLPCKRDKGKNGEVKLLRP